MNKIKTMLIKDVSPELNRSLDIIRATKYYGINKNELVLLALSEWVKSKEIKLPYPKGDIELVEVESEEVDF